MRGRSGATAPSSCFFVEKRARMCYNERMKTYDTIGIIGAMDVEVERIAREMTDASSESFARSAFTVGKIDGQKVVVVQSGIGKVNAALVASALVMRYGADAVLMTGIAGTVTRDLHTLDAFVPTDFLQYDVSMPGCEDGFIDVLGEVYLPASPELADALASASRAKRGVMATGESFVAGEEAVRDVLRRFPRAMGVDMESAAVAQVCRRLGVPFACLKVISDGCDDGEYADFKQAAADKAVSGVLALVRGRRT